MPTTRIVVELPSGVSYDVRVGTGLTANLGQRLEAFGIGGQVAVITDANVAPLYLAAVRDCLLGSGFRVVDITLPAGEESKTLECAGEIWEALAQARLTRSSAVLALGGGVVGDIAGFVASTYMRGIGLVQVPTTLLAMVDSSVGGKTGINLSYGKNLVGTFKQPLDVCASVEVLETLPEREWVCGFAEIAKMAAIGSDDFFFWLLESAEQLKRHDQATTVEAITRSVVGKADVVAEDEREERGVRECLNYGHTLGHAIENLAGYGVYSHGQAVAEGMRFAAELGLAVAGSSQEFVEAQEQLLSKLGIPRLPFKAEPAVVLDAMKGDKKVRGKKVRFVIPVDVGVWELMDVEDEVLLKHLEAWVK